MYRAPARGWSSLGNCPNLAKILFVQRVALRGRHVYFRSNYLGCPWPGPGPGPAGSRERRFYGWRRGMVMREGERRAAACRGALPAAREHPRAQGIPRPTSPAGEFGSLIYTDSLSEKTF